ncbi:hypothetical protein M0802_002699 [Mischocyttarus mexicanus]|nr:hypothetical protein M0802_002699 [Mischocyttarus mexicanus]
MIGKSKIGLQVKFSSCVCFHRQLYRYITLFIRVGTIAEKGKLRLRATFVRSLVFEDSRKLPPIFRPIQPPPPPPPPPAPAPAPPQPILPRKFSKTLHVRD